MYIAGKIDSFCLVPCMCMHIYIEIYKLGEGLRKCKTKNDVYNEFSLLMKSGGKSFDFIHQKPQKHFSRTDDYN